MPSLRLAACLGLAISLLLPAALRADNGEPVRLPERTIMGEGGSAAPVFRFRGETYADASLSERLNGAGLPGLPFSTLTIAAGSQETFALSFLRQYDSWSLSVAASQSRPDPFPQAVKEFSVSLSGRKMVRAGFLQFSVSAGGLWDLPAARNSGGRYIPDSISDGREVTVGLGGRFFPERPISPHLSVAGCFLDAAGNKDLKAVWPGWSADAGAAIRLSRRADLDLFLECLFDYGADGIKVQDICLPGAALKYRVTAHGSVAVAVRNLTDQRYEILPGFYGPGASAVVSYSQAF